MFRHDPKISTPCSTPKDRDAWSQHGGAGGESGTRPGVKSSGELFGDFSFGFCRNIGKMVPNTVPSKNRKSLKWLYQTVSREVS